MIVVGSGCDHGTIDVTEIEGNQKRLAIAVRSLWYELWPAPIDNALDLMARDLGIQKFEFRAMFWKHVKVMAAPPELLCHIQAGGKGTCQRCEVSPCAYSTLKSKRR